MKNRYKWFLGIAICLLSLDQTVANSEVNKVKNNVNNQHELRAAMKDYDNGKYEKAIARYKKVIDANEHNVRANYELGHIYLNQLEQFSVAEKYLKHAINSFTEDTIYIAYYHYAKCLQLLERFEEAKNNYEYFYNNGIQRNENAPLESDVLNCIEQCDYAIQERVNTNNTIIVENYGTAINTELSEYCPLILSDSLLLFTGRYKDYDKEKIDYKDEKFYENGYYSILDENDAKVKSIKDLQLTELIGVHNALVSKSITEDTIFIYRENNLWYSVLENGKFSKPIKLNDNINRAFYQNHCTISMDGKRLIFSSASEEFTSAYDDDNKGLDLFESRLGENNEWSTPVNMGPILNTSKNEAAPYLTPDGKTLYFSSKGHLGFGNYDVFKSEFKDGSWQPPVNLGFPINSGGDDVHYVPSEFGEGLLASNRTSSFGLMDIYRVKPLIITKPEYYKELEVNSVGVVHQPVVFDGAFVKQKINDVISYSWSIEDAELDEKSVALSYTFDQIGDYKVSLIVEGEEAVYHYQTIVTIVEGEKQALAESQSCKHSQHDKLEVTDRGKVNEPLAFNASYIDLGNEKIESYTWSINGVELEENTPVLQRMFKQNGKYYLHLKVQGEKGEYHYRTVITIGDNDLQAGQQEPQYLTPVYFGYDLFNLDSVQKEVMDMNIKLIAKYDNPRLEIYGHTDSKASKSYNLKLAGQRLETVLWYLIKSKVISKERISFVNHGELKPAEPNKLANGEDNPSGRKLNRRVEFKLIFDETGLK